MQLAGLDLNLLIALDALFTEKSVTRAGARINLGQSADWDLATGSPDEIRALASQFGLTYYSESGQITHSLVTAIIGPD
jgi:hypothetical protein